MSSTHVAAKRDDLVPIIADELSGAGLDRAVRLRIARKVYSRMESEGLLILRPLTDTDVVISLPKASGS